MVFIQKNKTNSTGNGKVCHFYDMFIHVLDTAYTY